MKSELKQLFRDLNAAVLLQRAEAVDIALNGLLRLPGVPANDRMNDGFITQVILPVGETLSGLQSSLLCPLSGHSLVVGRAIGAVALAHRFVEVGDVKPEDLHRPGSDTRAEVRISLGRTLVEAGKMDPWKIFNLGKNWISNHSPRLRQTALIFLPSLADAYAPELFELFRSVEAEDDHAVKGELVEALTGLGNKGFTHQVLHLLSKWSAHPQSDDWVTCRTLSASWAVDYPAEVFSILQEIYSKSGESKTITNTLKALKRNGLDINFGSDFLR